MKLIELLFILVCWTVVKGFIINDAAGTPTIVFPVLDVDSPDFIDLSGGCSGFVDCTEYLANVIKNIGSGIIFLVLFLIDLLVYLFELFALIATITFTGIEGAPSFVNVILTIAPLAGIAIMIYKMASRSEGTTET